METITRISNGATPSLAAVSMRSTFTILHQEALCPQGDPEGSPPPGPSRHLEAAGHQGTSPSCVEGLRLVDPQWLEITTNVLLVRDTDPHDEGSSSGAGFRRVTSALTGGDQSDQMSPGSQGQSQSST